MHEPYVFISSAHEDGPFAEKFQNLLEAQHVKTWRHERNIQPGTIWERELHIKLENAESLIVIASRSSIASDWVRAEVEYALSKKKRVIPVRIDYTELPVRWRMSQWIDWQDDSGIQVQHLIKVLPSGALRKLANALESPGHFDEVKALLHQFPVWLPVEYGRPDLCAFRHDASLEPEGTIDCFVGMPTSPGPMAYLYYFASPYEAPITQEGEFTAEVKQKLQWASQHSKTLREACPAELQLEHLLPKGLLEKIPRYGWRGDYAVRTRVVAGQRRFHHERHDTRSLLRQWELDAEIMSYTRLLELASKAQRGDPFDTSDE